MCKQVSQGALGVLDHNNTSQVLCGEGRDGTTEQWKAPRGIDDFLGEMQ